MPARHLECLQISDLTLSELKVGQRNADLVDYRVRVTLSNVMGDLVTCKTCYKWTDCAVLSHSQQGIIINMPVIMCVGCWPALHWLWLVHRWVAATWVRHTLTRGGTELL